MTNKLQQITTLSLATILIAGSFSLTPFAYSTGWNDDDDDDDDSNQQIQKGLCDDTDNLLTNGCFETPVVTNSKKWDVYNTVPGWSVNWLIDTNYDATDGINPCQTGEPGFTVAGYLELQKGILGGPSEGAQHAELDSDCNGPTINPRSGEKSSVGISQLVTTSEMNDYKITFAYKARPDQPLSTNGLMVSWNGDDITPNNLDFSKKKWKYASITVSVAADQDLSPLVFEDTGNPDSFGTFLDDVSVKAIPKPVIKITLNKEVDGGNKGPTDFTLRINGNQVTNGAENIYATAGSFNIDEDDVSNYVGALVASENCPFESLGESVELELGDVVECTILNTFTPPPTISVYHAVTNDNGLTLEPYDAQFELKVGIIDVENNSPIPVSAGVDFSVTTVEPDSYSLVLITGDSKCPKTIDDDINLESGEHINCWVYHEDDFVEGQTGGDGIIFHRNTIEFMYNAPNDDVADQGVIDNTGNAFNCSVGPCVQLDPTDSSVFIVHDSNIDKTTSLVVLNVFPLDITGNEAAETDRCQIKTLLPGLVEGTLSFSFQCELIEGQFFGSLGKYRVNYAVIDTFVG